MACMHIGKTGLVKSCLSSANVCPETTPISIFVIFFLELRLDG